MGLPLSGYIRVSSVAGRSGERFQSPTEQRATIDGWAKAHGIRIGAWFEDLDRSGGTMDRPGMNQALKLVEQGQSGGVVVARLDRFARTVIGGLTTIEELDRKGARVVSVAEQIDPATPVGRAMLGLLLIMAAWQRDQADEALAAAQVRAVSAGRFPGRCPYGYRRTETGQTIVDPGQAKTVRRIFTERAAGTGWRKIADNLAGEPTPTGKRDWAPSTVMGIVRSQAPLGVFVGPRGLRVQDAWPAIVDRELWAQANDRHGTRDSQRRHHDRLLAGLARCANCRRVLVRAVNPEGFVSYACTGTGCKQRGSVGAHILDSHTTTLIDARLAKITLHPSPADETEARRLQRNQVNATTELEQWRDDLEIRTALGDRDWREGMLARARARDGAEVEVAEYRTRMGAIADLPEGVTPRLDDLPWEVRRRVCEALLHSVWLRPSAVRGPGARRHVGSRVRVVWRDDPDRPVLPSPAGPQPVPVPWVPTRTGGPGRGGAGR